MFGEKNEEKTVADLDFSEQMDGNSKGRAINLF